MPSIRRPVPFGAIAAALYAISLVLPAVVAINKPLLWGSPREESMIGFQCLMLGWWSVPWYANLLLGIAAIGLECRRPTLAIACSITAIGLALTAPFYLGAELRALHVGYFAWLASMVVVLVASCAGRPELPARPDQGANGSR